MAEAEREVAAKAPAKGKAGKGALLEQLVLVLAPLVLTNAAEMRTVLGVLFLTGFMAK